MNEQVRAQVLRALAYGESQDRIIEAIAVSAEDISSIPQKEIDEEREYLRENGRR